MRLTDFQAFSFDCYGTLIDWESGICSALAPMLARAGIDLSQPAKPIPAGVGLARTSRDLSRDAILQAFARLESCQQKETPGMVYSDLLAEVHGQLAMEWDIPRDPAEDAAFGRSIADWPPFPDTIEALRYLKQHVRLIILSNVDRTSFQATNERLGISFDAIYTAQDIGSYKPDQRNFAYLIDRVAGQGTPPEKLLHVAQSLFHDHVPAQAAGLKTAWIDRRHAFGGWGATAPASPEARYDLRFTSLADLADAFRQASLTS
jgi:2-haloacid dehalogenase